VGTTATLDSFAPTVWKDKKKDDGCNPGQRGRSSGRQVTAEKTPSNLKEGEISQAETSEK
jgi:hypothetical protein